MNYKRIYSEIILNRVNNPLPEDVYGQRHHVLPRSLYPQYEKTKTNIVKLTYREHYICHWLLTKIKPCRQMINAFWRMNCCQNDLYFNSNAYKKARQNFINNNIYAWKKGQKPWNTGKKLSEEHKRKVSENHADIKGEKNPMFGKKHTLISRMKMTQSRTGKKLSEEHKRKMVAWKTGRKWFNNGKVEKFIDISNGIPDGFVSGRLKKNNMKINKI